MKRAQVKRVCGLLGETMDWRIDTTGKVWTVDEPECFQGLSFRPLALFSTMLRVLRGKPEHGGHGFANPEIRKWLEGARLTPRALPGGMSATDEATFLRVWPELGDARR